MTANRIIIDPKKVKIETLRANSVRSFAIRGVPGEPDMTVVVDLDEAPDINGGPEQED